jgi:NAD(P)-dependent dehydrogenase (short-subunit alcohol dehydrogenase family)
MNGKITLVTGGISGIGAAIADRFRSEGATVIKADITHGADIAVDVSSEESVAAMAASVLARHGRIDTLIHAAGIGRDIPFLETTAEAFDRIIAVNLRGTFLVCQAVARAMVAQGGGAIVAIASISGLGGNIGRAAYGASKAGVINLVQVMATELAGHGVRVNAIAPGPVETPLVARMHDAAIRESWQFVTPMNRYAAPEEIAGAAVFLCSDDASFMTGHVLTVDGGLSATLLARRLPPDRSR